MTNIRKHTVYLSVVLQEITYKYKKTQKNTKNITKHKKN